MRAWAASVPPAACFLSRASVAEIRHGIARVAEPGFRAELEAWLRDGVRAWFGARVLEADEAVLVAWRDLAREDRAARRARPEPDALIAATARVHGLGVATRNTRDFAGAGVAVLDPWTGGASA